MAPAAPRTGSGRFRSRAFGAGCDSRPVVGSRDAGRAHERHGGGRARGALQIRGPAQAGPAGADGTVRMREGRARAWAVRPCTCAVRPVVPLAAGRRCVMTTAREPATTAPLSAPAPVPAVSARARASVRPPSRRRHRDRRRLAHIPRRPHHARARRHRPRHPSRRGHRAHRPQRLRQEHAPARPRGPDPAGRRQRDASTATR